MSSARQPAEDRFSTEIECRPECGYAGPAFAERDGEVTRVECPVCAHHFFIVVRGLPGGN